MDCDHQSLIDTIRERSREIAPEYPGIHGDLSPFEHLWAITESYKGCSMANNDLHGFISYLTTRMGLTLTEAWEAYKKTQHYDGTAAPAEVNAMAGSMDDGRL